VVAGSFCDLDIALRSRIDRFTFRPATSWGGGNEAKKIAIVGNAKDEAKERLIKLLKNRGKLNGDGFDMEPFEVLRDIIRDEVDPTIGGAPQVAKVYRYMRTQHFAVEWPQSADRPHALGRPAMDYEQFGLPIIDPDRPDFKPKRMRQETEDLSRSRPAICDARVGERILRPRELRHEPTFNSRRYNQPRNRSERGTLECVTPGPFAPTKPVRLRVICRCWAQAALSPAMWVRSIAE